MMKAQIVIKKQGESKWANYIPFPEIESIPINSLIRLALLFPFPTEIKRVLNYAYAVQMFLLEEQVE